jgi:hypothetical protein
MLPASLIVDGGDHIFAITTVVEDMIAVSAVCCCSVVAGRACFSYCCRIIKIAKVLLVATILAVAGVLGVVFLFCCYQRSYILAGGPTASGNPAITGVPYIASHLPFSRASP